MEAAPTDVLTGPDGTGHGGVPLAAAPGPSSLVGGPFVDTAEHTLDGKWRLTLPAHARAAFAAGGLLVLWNGPCIAVLTEDGFRRWIAYAKRVVPNAGYDDPAGHLRFAHSQASRFKPDVQGRFQLVDRLRHAADIDREVTIVGAGTRLELWNPATYGADLAEYRQNLAFHQDQYDLMGEDLS